VIFAAFHYAIDRTKNVFMITNDLMKKIGRTVFVVRLRRGSKTMHQANPSSAINVVYPSKYFIFQAPVAR